MLGVLLGIIWPRVTTPGMASLPADGCVAPEPIRVAVTVVRDAIKTCLNDQSTPTATASAAKSSTPARPRDSPKSADRSPSPSSPRAAEQLTTRRFSSPGPVDGLKATIAATASPYGLGLATKVALPSPHAEGVNSQPAGGLLFNRREWPSFRSALTRGQARLRKVAVRHGSAAGESSREPSNRDGSRAARSGAKTSWRTIRAADRCVGRCCSCTSQR